MVYKIHFKLVQLNLIGGCLYHHIFIKNSLIAIQQIPLDPVCVFKQEIIRW